MSRWSGNESMLIMNLYTNFLMVNLIIEILKLKYHSDLLGAKVQIISKKKRIQLFRLTIKAKMLVTSFIKCLRPISPLQNL